MRLADLPTVPLAVRPTPLDDAGRLSEYLGGPRILVKRDDLTGLAFGGNKARKLEYLMADAIAHRADVVITVGAVQSNHARQTAAACNRLGLRCILVLEGEPGQALQGNLLLDHLLGAEVRLIDTEEEYVLMGVVSDLVRELRDQGHTPYVIPMGGSNALGAAAYAAAFEELRRQAGDRRIDAIVHASSSGGTQAGLLAGVLASGSPIREIGISVGHPRGTVVSRIMAIMREMAERHDTGIAPHPDHVIVYDDWIGPGYAQPSAEGGEAIRIAARTEGLVLDPVYTGKAMAGLSGLIRRGAFTREQTVVFWHTGGGPALFAKPEGLVETP